MVVLLHLIEKKGPEANNKKVSSNTECFFACHFRGQWLKSHPIYYFVFFEALEQSQYTLQKFTDCSRKI
jgi:hypothetical protein